MSAGPFKIVENLPYPRAAHAGRLRDRAGTPLHGAYERPVSGGSKTSLINNGLELARWPTRWSALRNPFPSVRHSFTNLVHHGGIMWAVGADAERPVTRHPAREYPLATGRCLWHDPFQLQAVIAGSKPIALLSGSPDEVELHLNEATSAGLAASKPVRHKFFQRPHCTMQVSAPGRLASAEDLAAIEDFYGPRLHDRQAVKAAVKRLEPLTGDVAVSTDYTNPSSDDQCIVTGWVFGYPPITTLSFIAGNNS